MATKRGAKTAVLEVGSKVKFLGYSDTGNMAEVDMVLNEGDIGEIVEVDAKEKVYVLEIPNPNFDSSKRASKSNQKMMQTDAFFEEVEAYEGGDEEQEQGEEEGETTAKKTATKKKSKSQTKREAAQTPPKGRAKPPKKKTKAAAEEEQEQEEEQADRDTGSQVARLDNEDEDILAMVDGISNEDLLDLAHEVIEEASSADYKVGGILYHVRLSGAYQDLKDEYAEKKGFERYINEELGMEYRKAMYLIDIYYKFNLYGIGSDFVAEHGWTKASQIARVMTDDNADALVKLATESTVEELKDTIREDYTITGGAGTGTTKAPAAKRITFKFRLFEDQAVGVEQILAQAGEMMNNDDTGQVFEHIMTEWAQEHLDVRAQQAIKRASNAARRAAKQAAAGDAKEEAPKGRVKRQAPGTKAATKKAAPKKAAPKKRAAPKRKAA